MEGFGKLVNAFVVPAAAVVSPGKVTKAVGKVAAATNGNELQMLRAMLVKV
jgi:hypothetical protein